MKSDESRVPTNTIQRVNEPTTGNGPPANEVRATTANGPPANGVTAQAAPGSANEEIRAGAAIALVAAMAAASKVAESNINKPIAIVNEEIKGQGEQAAQPNPVTEPIKDKRIKSLFLDNLHLFFGDIHLIPIKEFINPSHQLNQHRDMITMNETQRESYEHGRLLTLLKTMFFRESQGTISKEGNILRGGGITIEQLKNKIKKGISLIKPKT